MVYPAPLGFGFSGKPTTTEWGVDRIAGAFDQLMKTPGYQRFGAEGGYWSSAVTRALELGQDRAWPSISTCRLAARHRNRS